MFVGFSGISGDQTILDSWTKLIGKPMFSKEQIAEKTI